jgi:eukaryotic-like serine/threonine-protein kinase
MNENIKQSFWFHLLLVALIFSFLYISFFFTLGFLTHHGEQVQIPSLKGKTVEQAVDELRRLNFEVTVDSSFEPLAKPLTVLKQVPDIGSMVKTGRTVMITVNSVTPQRVPMPNLVGLSYMSGEMLLKNNKMLVGDTTYVPDIAKGAILQQKYKGQIVRSGELVPQGSKIDLVIGNGLGNTEFEMPEVTGYTVDIAFSIISQYNLIPNYVVRPGDGEIIDTFSATVIQQIPPAYNEAGVHNKIKMGDVIDLIIKQNPEPGDIQPSGAPKHSSE